MVGYSLASTTSVASERYVHDKDLANESHANLKTATLGLSPYHRPFSPAPTRLKPALAALPVPRGTERLRITPTPGHDDALIDALAEALAAATLRARGRMTANPIADLLSTGFSLLYALKSLLSVVITLIV